MGSGGNTGSQGQWNERRWAKKLLRFAPAALAATLEQLKWLAGAKILCLRNAVIVLYCDSGAPPGINSQLTEADRDFLWDVFRVPVFEQIIGENGELLATECEAHNGLHIESAAFPSGGQHLELADLDLTPCPCGRRTPRFAVQPATPQPGPDRRAAAHA